MNELIDIVFFFGRGTLGVANENLQPLTRMHHLNNTLRQVSYARRARLVFSPARLSDPLVFPEGLLHYHRIHGRVIENHGENADAFWCGFVRRNELLYERRPLHLAVLQSRGEFVSNYRNNGYQVRRL